MVVQVIVDAANEYDAKRVAFENGHKLIKGDHVIVSAAHHATQIEGLIKP